MACGLSCDPRCVACPQGGSNRHAGCGARMVLSRKMWRNSVVLNGSGVAILLTRRFGDQSRVTGPLGHTQPLAGYPARRFWSQSIQRQAGLTARRSPTPL